MNEEFWKHFFFIAIFYISLYLGIMVGFQEGKPVNNFFICTKLDPREFEDVPKSVFHPAPLVFGCKNFIQRRYQLWKLKTFKFLYSSSCHHLLIYNHRNTQGKNGDCRRRWQYFNCTTGIFWIYRNLTRNKNNFNLSLNWYPPTEEEYHHQS